MFGLYPLSKESFQSNLLLTFLRRKTTALCWARKISRWKHIASCFPSRIFFLRISVKCKIYVTASQDPSWFSLWLSSLINSHEPYSTLGFCFPGFSLLFFTLLRAFARQQSDGGKGGAIPKNATQIKRKQLVHPNQKKTIGTPWKYNPYKKKTISVPSQQCWVTLHKVRRDEESWRPWKDRYVE